MPEAHDDAAQWAEWVSLQKAQGVARRVQGGLILAGDTIAILGHRVIGKPADRAHAEQILRGLMGTTHQVITALALLDVQTGRWDGVTMSFLGEPQALTLGNVVGPLEAEPRARGGAARKATVTF